MNRAQERIFISICAKSADDTLCNIRYIRVMAKWLATVYIRQMDFDKGNCNGRKRIPDRDAGMCERRRIKDDKFKAVLNRGLNPLYQVVLRITLAAIDIDIVLRRKF